MPVNLNATSRNLKPQTVDALLSAKRVGVDVEGLFRRDLADATAPILRRTGFGGGLAGDSAQPDSSSTISTDMSHFAASYVDNARRAGVDVDDVLQRAASAGITKAMMRSPI